MDTMTQVIAALYVALGEAAGGDQAIRTANRVLREAIADRVVVDPLAVSVLESLANDEEDRPLIDQSCDVASTIVH
jgi:hypothetical protein